MMVLARDFKRIGESWNCGPWWIVSIDSTNAKHKIWQAFHECYPHTTGVGDTRNKALDSLRANLKKRGQQV